MFVTNDISFLDTKRVRILLLSRIFLYDWEVNEYLSNNTLLYFHCNQDFLRYFIIMREILVHTSLNTIFIIFPNIYLRRFYDLKFLHETNNRTILKFTSHFDEKKPLYSTILTRKFVHNLKFVFFLFLFAGKLSLYALLTFEKIGYVDDKRHRWVEIYVAILFSSRIRDAAFQFPTTHILFMRQCVECKFSTVGENAHGPHTFEYRRINPYEMSVKTRENPLTICESLSLISYTLWLSSDWICMWAVLGLSCDV